MMRIFKLCTIIAFVFSITLHAGSYFGSKPKGLGIRHYTVSVRGMGMGGTGLASTDSLALNNNVVSQWRYISITRTTIGVSYYRFTSEVNNTNFTTSTADFGGVNIAIPIQKKKWVFGVSLQPYTVIDFKGTQTVDSDGITFTQVTQFIGSISKAQVSLVWAPVSSLGIAVSGNYFFGSIDDRFDFKFNDASYVNSSHVVQYQIAGPGVGVSANFQPVRQFNVAGFIDFKPKLDITIKYSSPIAITEERERNLNTFPLHYGVGGQFQLSNRLTIAADYSYQNWASVLKTSRTDFEEWYHWGVGIEHSASGQRKSGFFNRLDFRAGVSSTQLGYKFNNQSVIENAIHLGFGIPFGRHRNRIDISFMGGIRGDKSKNLAEEMFLKAQFSVSMGERWFQSFR